MFFPPSHVLIELGQISGLSPRPPSPVRTVRARDALTPPLRPSAHGKRRSMSVGEVDLKKAANSSLTPIQPLPDKRSEESMGWDSTIRGILSDFDNNNIATSESLDLGVASTSRQRLARLRIRSAEPTTSNSTQGNIRQATSSPPPNTWPNPTIVAHAPDTDETSTRTRPASIEPPEGAAAVRPVPLFGGAAPRGFSYSQRPFPAGITRPMGPRSASSAHAPSEARERLLSHRRPTAFSSEPSLVPANANAVSSPLPTLSQQDLFTNPNPPFRRLLSDKSAPTDPEELEARAKECARRAWEEDEEFLVKERIAEWLGGM